MGGRGLCAQSCVAPSPEERWWLAWMANWSPFTQDFSLQVPPPGNPLSPGQTRVIGPPLAGTLITSSHHLFRDSCSSLSPKTLRPGNLEEEETNENHLRCGDRKIGFEKLTQWLICHLIVFTWVSPSSSSLDTGLSTGRLLGRWPQEISQKEWSTEIRIENSQPKMCHQASYHCVQLEPHSLWEPWDPGWPWAASMG